MCNGWIKLHRKILDWEWFSCSATFHVFMFLLLKASTEDKQWKGIEIKRGQLVVSVANISDSTHLTTQQIRTALKRLKSTNEITIKSTNKYSLITICKYESYQLREDNEQQTKSQSTQQSDNKQITNKQQHLKNIRIEEDKEELSLTNVRESEKKVATVVATPPQELMKARLDKFYKSLIPYVETYGREMVRDFYNYWSEPNKSKTKFRAELEPTWDAGRRLATWAKKDSVYGRANNSSGSASTREQRTAEFLAHVQERLEQPDDYAETLPWEE